MTRAKDEPQLRRRLLDFILIRFGYTAILALAGVGTELIDLGWTSVVVVDILTGLVALGVNAILFGLAYLRRESTRYYHAIGAAAIMIDVLVITYIIYSHGGVESRSIGLYAIPIVSAGIIFRPLANFVMAIICAAIYDMVLILQWQELIGRPAAVMPQLHQDPGYLLQTITFYDLTFLVIALVANFSSRLLLNERTALKEKQVALDRAQRIAHLASWELNVKTGEMSWSDEVFTMRGYGPQDFEPNYRQWLGGIHPDDRLKVKQALVKVARHGQPFSIDYRIVRPDKQVRYVHAEGVLVDGVEKKVFATSLDTTEQALNDKDLRRRTEELEKLTQLMVGRELKMIELKKELAQAQKKGAKNG